MSKVRDANSEIQKEVIHFVSKCENFEEKSVTWEIKNFFRYLQSKPEDLLNLGITFEVGQCIGIPAKWEFHFIKRCNPLNSESYLDMSLNLASAPGFETVEALTVIQIFDGTKVLWASRNDATRYYGERVLTTNITTEQFQEMIKNISLIKIQIDIKVFETKGFAPVLQKQNGVPSKKEIEAFQNKFLEDFALLLKDNILTDLTIKVPLSSKTGNEFHSMRAHKAVLAARSKVFAAMLDPEKNMLEGEKGEVEIVDLSPTSLKVLLEYIYTGNVSKEWKEVAEEILNAAEKYDLPELKDFCGRNLVTVVNDNNLLEILRLAKLHNFPEAQKEIMKILKEGTKVDDLVNLLLKL